MNHSRNWKLGLAGALMFALVMLVAPSPRPPPPLPSPLEAPVPLLEYTPTADAGPVRRSVLGKLPPPAANQRKSGQCDPEQAQVELNGGCWVQTTTPPPCPLGKQWEHEGRCWLPVGVAKPAPTSGGGEPRGVADP